MQEIVSKLQISEVMLIFLFLIEEWQLLLATLKLTIKEKSSIISAIIKDFLWVTSGIRTHDLRSPINQPLSDSTMSSVCKCVCTNKDTN